MTVALVGTDEHYRKTRMDSTTAVLAAAAAAAALCACGLGLSSGTTSASSTRTRRGSATKAAPARAPAAVPAVATTPGEVHHVESDEEFKALIASGKTVVVDFWATWCGPCKMIAPLYTQLAAANPDVVFCKVDVDECEDTMAACDVKAMPTFQAYVGGQKVAAFSGADKLQLEGFVEKVAAGATKSKD